MKPHGQANLYVALDEGGCADAGTIRFDGHVLISNADYIKMRAGQSEDLIRVLNQAAWALHTPDGKAKLKKHKRAVEEIKAVLGPLYKPEKV